MFVYGVSGDNFLLPSVGDSNDVAFVWIIPSASHVCRLSMSSCSVSASSVEVAI